MSNTLWPQQLSCALIRVTFFTSGSIETIPVKKCVQKMRIRVCKTMMWRRWTRNYLQTMKAPRSFKAAGVPCTATQHHTSGQLYPRQQSSQKLASHTLRRIYIMTGSSIMTAQRILSFVLWRVGKIGKINHLDGKMFTHKCDTGNLSALIQC